MNETSPPLKVWLYTVSTILVLVLISVFGLQTEKKNKQIEYKNINTKVRKILKVNNSSNAARPSVVFLGSSLIGHALYNLNTIDEKFELKKTKASPKICSIAINALDNEKINKLKLFEELVNHPPDYLFIEINHILVDGEETELTLKYLKIAINNLFLFVKNTIGLAPEKTINFFKIKPENALFHDQFNIEDYKQLLQKKRSVRLFNENKILNEACLDLQLKKTKIIFIDLPRAPQLEQIWLSSTQKKVWIEVLKKYQRSYKIDFWKYPNLLNNSDFVDGGHLNYKGAKKYQDWLITQFKLLP
ncbi:hypothetical protein [Flavobacterium sp. GNP001]